MVKGVIAEKVEMSQVFDRHNRVVAVTKLRVAPNYVVAVKEVEKDGYKAAQIGAGVDKRAKKPQIGVAKKVGLKAVPRLFREVQFEGDLQPGEEINLEEVLRKGQLVDITGFSKGKGFAGVVKRWGFAGGPRTHGQSDRERAPGSIGATTTPGRVYKGLKMAGHMGNEQVTAQGLEIIEIDKEEGEVLVRGSVPGARGSFLLIKKSKKKKKAYHEPEIPETPVVAAAKEEEAPEEAKREVVEAPTQDVSQEGQSKEAAKGE
jgi:large subunit ribosomal protein L3